MTISNAVYRHVISEARDFAVIMLDVDGRILEWNTGAEVMFGYSSDEVTGQPFDLLFVPEDRASSAPQRELQVARTTGRAEDRRWHLRKSGARFFCDGVTTPVLGDDGKLAGFTKIARDTTERQLGQQRLAAQLALTTVLAEETSEEVASRRIMQTICERLDWDLGGLWKVSEDGRTINCLEIWSAPGIDSGEARLLCSRGDFGFGEGLPGIVWQTREPLWSIDFSDNTLFPRAELARNLGMRSAFAFPILLEGRVVGAMEFFSRTMREPDQALLPVMALIGVQIGTYFERRRVIAALRESEARYRVVIDTAPDAIFAIDESSTIVYCNPSVKKIFGFEPADLVGKNLDVIMPQRLREAHRQGLAHYIRTGERRIPWNGFVLLAVGADGIEFPVEISFGEMRQGGKRIFTGFLRDVRERAKAAEELRHALEIEQAARVETEAARAQLERRADEEASFRHLASALNGAVEMTDVLNEIVSRATLVTRADGVYVERIARDARVVEVVASMGRGAPQRGLRVEYPGSMTEEIMRGKVPVILAEMSGLGGSMAPYLTDSCAECQVLVTPLIADQEPLGALVLLNSRASGRTFGEAEIVRARTLGDLASLALRRVRLMEQEREAKERAEAAVRVRDETLGIVSHDLRNPLTRISLSAELIPGSPPEEQAELVTTVREAARQAQRLIQDLLDVARVEAGRFAVKKAMMNPAVVIERACEANRPLAEQKGIALECAIEDGLPEVCADRDRVSQVLSNLVGNAIKFTPPGGTISIEAQRGNGEIVCRVRDSGPGIPESDLPNLFRAYWQAKKTAHLGAGLGLAIVRGIVEAHGGHAWAENSPEGGAVFSFTLPAV